MSVISEQTVVFTSVTVQVKNLRNELRLDPVSALATQWTRTATATVWWCVLYCGSSFLQGTMVWFRSRRRLHSKFNERKIVKGETWVIYRTSIVYFFSLNSLRKRVKHEWRKLKVSRISSILSIFGRKSRLNCRYGKMQSGLPTW